MIPSTVPATPVSLAQVGREFLKVFTDVVDALEHDLASRVADMQLDAPSFVHATQFDALQGDIDADEEALPADPPPVIHHTMFSPSDPVRRRVPSNFRCEVGETPFGSCFQREPTSSGGW